MLIPSALMQSMASFVAQNVGAGNQKRAKQSMLTGIGVGLAFGCAVFALVMLKGDVLAGIFSPDAEVVQKGFEYLKGFAPETILKRRRASLHWTDLHGLCCPAAVSGRRHCLAA